MKLKVIAYARNGHTDKFGIPRQSRDESPICTRIVFEPEFSVQEALRGIEGFSHLWLLWGFSEVPDISQTGDDDRELTWSPTVRPPRLGGNKRVGVFATRSPFRPNPLGLSSVKLLNVQRENVQGAKDSRMVLLVSGADLLDGTPIYDIKPYLSFSDSHPDAQNGFAEEHKDHRLKVLWGGNSSEWFDVAQAMPSSWFDDMTYILSQDPRPAYQDDPDREYKLDYAGYRVTFGVKGSDNCAEGTVTVKNIEKI